MELNKGKKMVTTIKTVETMYTRKNTQKDIADHLDINVSIIREITQFLGFHNGINREKELAIYKLSNLPRLGSYVDSLE
ncbi:hypothetical protein GSQ54_15845 [Clostridioides difficile]|nr:hypothetical protein [Clostridioides difficile]